METAAAEVRLKDRQELREYVELVLPQLNQFVARELRYREMAGRGESGDAQQDEIVNEVVARAFERVQSAPADSVPPFHRLIAEAIQVLNASLAPTAPPEAPGSRASGEATAAAAGKVGAAHLWREVQGALPPVEILREHPPDPVDLCLASLPVLERQVYVLHALEGFRWDEAAPVLGKSPVEIEEIFHRVRQQVAVTLQGKQTSQ